MRILIAEDDSLSRTLLERTLQRAGYEVIVTEDGARAVQELDKEDPPRHALLDWIMPGLNGAEFCPELRTRKNKRYTYPILLSSKESKQDIVQGVESGADDYLTKPFDAGELKARLRAGQRILDLEDRLVEGRESMRFQATHDLLTSLWNRSVIVELLLREVHRYRRERNYTAVLMCDIDHFKSVNDSLGHAAGDDVLREVSRRLRTSVRSYDMVGRYGGEEFLVVLNKCDPASAVHRTENLRQSIFSRPIHLAPPQLTVRISLGLALSSDFPRCDVEELLNHADMALCAARASGRNCVRIAQPESTDKRVDLPDVAPDKESPLLTS
jgi:two-component system cell cycle response regulator